MARGTDPHRAREVRAVLDIGQAGCYPDKRPANQRSLGARQREEVDFLAFGVLLLFWSVTAVVDEIQASS